MYLRGNGKTVNGFHCRIASSYLLTEIHLEILAETLSAGVTRTSHVGTGGKMLKRNEGFCGLGLHNQQICMPDRIILCYCRLCLLDFDK